MASKALTDCRMRKEEVSIRYLDDPSHCVFFRHKAEVRINRILRAIRQTDLVKDTDRIIVQALLEIVDDIRVYGPFSILIRKRSVDEMITVYYNQQMVLTLMRSSDGAIGISYLRDSDLAWAEELCVLAAAHAEIITD